MILCSTAVVSSNPLKKDKIVLCILDEEATLHNVGGIRDNGIMPLLFPQK